MKFFENKRTQRLTNFALAAILVMSTLTASVPFLFSKTASALAETGYNLKVSTSCVNGLVVFNVTGDNPTTSAWVKSSADFKISAPIYAAQGATNVPIPLNDTAASVPASAATIYYSTAENGSYQLLNDSTAVAPYAAFNCFDTIYVAANGSDTNSGTSAATPFATVQKALNTVNAGGTIHIANGTYTEKISFTKGNINVVGDSKVGVIIQPLSNEYGQGFTSEGFGDITVSNLTVQANGPSAGGSAMKFHNAKNITLSNIAVNGSGYIRGIDLNAIEGATLNNVNVNGFGKNGIAVTSQYATTDAYTSKNINFTNVQSAGNSWAGLAFYTLGGGGGSADINGVTFAGANRFASNGQFGIFFEGGSDTGASAHTTPIHSIAGVNGASVDLGNTTLNSNAIANILNYQLKNVYVTSATIEGIMSSSMNGTQLAAAEATIIDHNDYDSYGDVILDTNAPIVAITSPADGATVSGTVTVTGTVSDTNPSVSYMTATNDTTQQQVAEQNVNTGLTNPSISWNSKNYADGSYTIHLEAKDTAGNEDASVSVRNIHVIVDNSAPVVAITSHTNGQVVSGTVTINGTVADAHPSVSYLTVRDGHGNLIVEQNVNTAQTNPTVTFDSKTVTDGIYYVHLEAKDTQGNETTVDSVRDITIVVDNLAPLVAITAPNNGAKLHGTVNVTGTVIDAHPSVSYLTIRKDDGTLILEQNVNTAQTNPSLVWNTTTVADGTYKIHLEAKDTQGNETTVDSVRDITVTVDNHVTTPTLVAPLGGAIVSGASVMQTWSSPDSDIDHYIYQSFNDAAGTSLRFTANYTSTSKTAQNITDGTVYYWRVAAVDTVGNQSAFSPLWKISIDNVAPTAAFTFPGRGPSATSFTVKYNKVVNITDATNSANYFLTNWPGAGGSGDLNGHAVVTYDVASKTATIHFTTPGWYVSGEQMWGVSGVRDIAGNVIVTTTAYSSPLTSPTAPGIPTTTTPTNSSVSNWTWTAATDLPTPASDASGIKGYQYMLTEGDEIITNWTAISTTSVTTNNPADGTYQLHVRALDNAGSTAGPESVGTVVIDTAPPAVEITSPTSGATFGNGSAVKIKGTTDDATSYVLLIGNGDELPLVTDAGTSFNSYIWNTSKVASGSYIATLTGTDAAGNSKASEVVINVDNTAPTIVIAPQTNTTGNQPTITGTVDDVNAALQATFNNGTYPVTNNAGTFSFTAPSPLSNGTYSFALRASDVHGNVSTQTADVIVAVVPPATTPVTTVTPTIIGPSQSSPAVLGATTTSNTDNTPGDTGVKGTSSDKTLAAAVNSDANKGTIFGLAWFWWILILAALAAIAWFITAAIRRRNEEQA